MCETAADASGRMTDNSWPAERVIIAGAGYAGLHVALRLAVHPDLTRRIRVTLVDRHDYHQVLTELPRVAAGTRAAHDMRLPLARILEERMEFVLARVTGLSLAERRLLVDGGALHYTRLVLALGSRPNDFAIPGLAERAIALYSVDDARRVRDAVMATLQAAVTEVDPNRRQCLATIVVGGGGATGVELAGELADTLPQLASRVGLPANLPRVILVEAGPTVLAGSSPDLIQRATRTLTRLGVAVRTNARIAAATRDGFKLENGDVVEGGAFVWAGGVKAPDLVVGSGLPVGHNGRVKVDQYLRALDHPEIFVAGDVASVVDPATGHVVPPLAQIALDEAETVARNLVAALAGEPLQPYQFHYKGFVLSIGTQNGVADVLGHVFGGPLVHVLKDAIEWEYRQSVRHLRGWSLLSA
jgi:NADH:ubiquinone reductase (H+-translocating)